MLKDEEGLLRIGAEDGIRALLREKRQGRIVCEEEESGSKVAAEEEAA